MDHYNPAACPIDAQEIARLCPAIVADDDVKLIEKISHHGVDRPNGSASTGVWPSAIRMIEMGVNAAEHAVVYPRVEV